MSKINKNLILVLFCLVYLSSSEGVECMFVWFNFCLIYTNFKSDK